METAGRIKKISKLLESEHKKREELAADLHDGIFQIIAGIKVRLDFLSSKKMSRSLRREIEDIRHLVNTAYDEGRSFMKQVRYPELHEEKDLFAALDRLVQKVRGFSDIGITLDCTGDQKTFTDLECESFFRSISELLINALKYSGGDEIAIKVHAGDQEAEASVTDNGKGIELEGPSKGTGLEMVRERIAHLKGKLTIANVPGNGAMISFTVPLKSRSKVNFF